MRQKPEKKKEERKKGRMQEGNGKGERKMKNGRETLEKMKYPVNAEEEEKEYKERRGVLCGDQGRKKEVRGINQDGK